MSDSKPNDLETPEEILESEIKDLERRTLNSGWLWAAAAVGLMLIAGTAFLVTAWDRSRQAGHSLPFAPQAISLTEPMGVVSSVDEFRWDRIDGAANYIVLVKAADRSESPILRPISVNALRPTESEDADLVPGVYTWSVEARAATGTLIGYGEGTFTIGAAPK
jgi:hypothetical protein